MYVVLNLIVLLCVCITKISDYIHIYMYIFLFRGTFCCMLCCIMLCQKMPYYSLLYYIMLNKNCTIIYDVVLYHVLINVRLFKTCYNLILHYSGAS